jgi:beta-glucosidase
VPRSTVAPTTIPEGELAARAASLTLEQKVRLITGADFWSLHPEPAAGLRRMVVSDGPAGVRGERWDERDSSANVPSPTALAATWDPGLVHGLGGLLASEARRKGVDVVLAPTVNLQRTPFGGRHFECFSEDPLLTARIGIAYVRGLQEGGVAATAKHFIANDSETERMTLDARVDERTFRELYLAPFEAIVREAMAWSVMAAYNRVNGQSMTESSLLRDVLHDELGFDGVVMSDWFATRSTVACANSGLDLAMPGPDGPWGPELLAAVRRGEVDEATIEDKVVRVLRLASRVGALEGTVAISPPRFGDAEVGAMLRRAAAAGFVLARNERAALPLDPGAVRRVAVIGPNAAAGRTLGGGSATVFPPYAVSPLAGLRAALPQAVAVEHCVGVLASDRIPVAAAPWLQRPDGGGPGVELRLVAADGAVVSSEHRTGCAFTWLGSSAPRPPVARIEVHTVIRATEPGTYTIAVSGLGRYSLSVDRTIVFDGRLELPPEADVVEGLMIPPQAPYPLQLDRGETVEVVLAHQLAGNGEPGGVGVNFQLNLQPPHGSDDEEIARAVSLARDADVAVIVVGTTAEVESEGFDRSSLALPGRQDELVQSVSGANPRTVVVVNSGAPVLLPWADQVAAILLAWFPGQEFGNALADVLLGRAEPGGRLPTTWPADERGLPSTRPRDGALSYDEGLFIGYRGYDRGGRRPLYPFGHGLGFTAWRYMSIDIPAKVASGADLRVFVGVSNLGDRRGREVVQVYASRPDGGVERPIRWLAGFTTVEAEAGEDVKATVTIPARAFEHWSVDEGRWTLEPGTFRLSAGPSCAELPVSAEVVVSAELGSA